MAWYFDEAIFKWHLPSEALPDHAERVIIILKAGGREQFATWNDQSGVFTNAGGTQFKPSQVKFWLSVKALPPLPDQSDYLNSTI